MLGNQYGVEPPDAAAVDALGSTAAETWRRLLHRHRGKAHSVARYFLDMDRAVAKCRRMLNDGGMAVFVIGNTQYRNVRIDNAKHLTDCMERAGFRAVEATERKVSWKIMTPYRDSRGRFTRDSTQAQGVRRRVRRHREGAMNLEALSFRPYARLLTMLGDQLIKNERIALVELIKNAYDADADGVEVRFENFEENMTHKRTFPHRRAGRRRRDDARDGARAVDASRRPAEVPRQAEGTREDRAARGGSSKAKRASDALPS